MAHPGPRRPARAVAVLGGGALALGLLVWIMAPGKRADDPAMAPAADELPPAAAGSALMSSGSPTLPTVAADAAPSVRSLRAGPPRLAPTPRPDVSGPDVVPPGVPDDPTALPADALPQLPRATFQPMPPWPEGIDPARGPVDVRVFLRVGPDGAVQLALPVPGTPPDLGAAAAAGAARWLFEPNGIEAGPAPFDLFATVTLRPDR